MRCLHPAETEAAMSRVCSLIPHTSLPRDWTDIMVAWLTFLYVRKVVGFDLASLISYPGQNICVAFSITGKGSVTDLEKLTKNCLHVLLNPKFFGGASYLD